MQAQAAVSVVEEPKTTTTPTGREHEGDHTPRNYEVLVAYNGVEKTFKVSANEPVQVLLNAAIREFHVSAQPHMLSLYNAAGVELPDAAKLGDIGVGPDDHLLMRPSAVKGG